MKKKLLVCMALLAMLVATFGTVSVSAVEDVPSDTVIEDVVTEDSSAVAGAEETIAPDEDSAEEEHYGNEFVKNELLPVIKNILVSIVTFLGLLALCWKQVKKFYESIKEFASKCGIATEKSDKVKEEMEQTKTEIKKSEEAIEGFKAELENLNKKLDICMRADKMAKLNDPSLIASGVAQQIEEVYNESNNG